MSVSYLARHIYQCARLHQLLNLGLEQPRLYRPKTTQNHNMGLGNTGFFLKKRKKQKKKV